MKEEQEETTKVSVCFFFLFLPLHVDVERGFDEGEMKENSRLSLSVSPPTLTD